MPKWMAWAWGGFGLVAVLVVVFATSRFLQARGRAHCERVLTSLSDSAKSLEGAGRFDEARQEIEKALDEIGKLGPGNSERIDALRQRRDDLARRGASAFLAGAGNMSPDQAIKACEALQLRTRKDPALSGLEEAIGEQLQRSRRQWAESDAAAARRAAAGGQPLDAIKLSTRLFQTADDLPRDLRKRFQGEAEKIVTEVVARVGVVFDPIQGKFYRSSSQDYAATLHPLLDAAFAKRGFVLLGPSSRWSRIWDSVAPYHMKIDLNERQEGTYDQSLNRLTMIEARITLIRQGSVTWNVGPLIARSHSPLPNMTVYETRYSTGKRDDEFERRLYKDARDVLVDKLNTLFRNLPELSPASLSTSNG